MFVKLLQVHITILELVTEKQLLNKPLIFFIDDFRCNLHLNNKF